jgi:hypothetical protein
MVTERLKNLGSEKGTLQHGKIRSVNFISEFQIPGIGGVKEATHDKNV